MPPKKYKNPAFSGSPGPAPTSPPELLQGLLFNPNGFSRAVMGVRPPEPRALGFQTLREMARVTQPVVAIIRTRQNQVARFARLPRFEGDVGVQVRMRDLDARPTKADKRRMRELEDIILKCGVGPADGLEKRPGLDHFLRMSVADSLTLDAVAVELRTDRRGNLYDWWALDAATIRKTVPSYQPGQVVQAGQMMFGIQGEGYGGAVKGPGTEAAFVQLVNQVPYAEFAADELAYWIRNPRTDLESNGYGHAELETLIEVVVGYLNAMLYNQRYFTHSSIPEGVLSVTGSYTNENLDDFRRYWNAMVTGVNNSWRVPILATKDGKGVNWTPLKTNNREMMFHEWMDFLTTLACAVFQIDREELGFGSKGAGEASSMSEGSNQPTLAHSQSKGLFPLLTRLEAGINEDILPRLPNTEDFTFAWAGLDPDQEDQKIDRDVKLLTASLMTVNEGRAKRDMPKIPEDQMWGDAPQNPQLYQAWTMAKQAELQAQGLMPGDDQGGGEEGGEDADPPKLPKVNADGSEEDDDDQAPASGPPLKPAPGTEGGEP
jgi:hypothetical protein